MYLHQPINQKSSINHCYRLPLHLIAHQIRSHNRIITVEPIRSTLGESQAHRGWWPTDAADGFKPSGHWCWCADDDLELPTDPEYRHATRTMREMYRMRSRKVRGKVYVLYLWETQLNHTFRKTSADRQMIGERWTSSRRYALGTTQHLRSSKLESWNSLHISRCCSVEVHRSRYGFKNLWVMVQILQAFDLVWKVSK